MVFARFEQMTLPAKRLISTPIVAAALILSVFLLASIVFGQASAGDTRDSSGEVLLRWIGGIATVIGILTIAAAAVYNAWRKAAVTEWKELAEARKGKLVEAHLEAAERDARIKELEVENEELLKLNLRLQGKSNDQGGSGR